MTRDEVLRAAAEVYGRERDAMFKVQGADDLCATLTVKRGAYEQVIDVSQLATLNELATVLSLMVQAFDREAPPV